MHKFDREHLLLLACFLGGVLLTAALYPHLPFDREAVSGTEVTGIENSRDTGRMGRSGRNAPPDEKIAHGRAGGHANRKSGKAGERGLARREIPSDFKLYNDEGEVTREALELAGVPPGKAEEIQRLVDELRARGERELRKRIYVDEAESDPENGVTVYRAPADPAAGDQILYEFEEGLINAAGTSSAKILMEGIEPEFEFGWYGKLDLKIRVDVNDERTRFNPNGIDITWTCTDPTSGWKGNGSATPELFEKRFGRLFGSDGKLRNN
jgi:hypothetical protein